MTSVEELGQRAKAASRILATAPTDAKNAALHNAADLLLERAAEIQAANDGRSRGRGRGGHGRGAARPAAAHQRPARRDGRRAAHGGRPRRPDRRRARRLDAAQRLADHARARAARCRRDHLREPPERDERRGRAVPEVGERGAAAWLVERAAVQRRDRRGAARGAREARAARRRGPARRGHRARDRDAGDAAHRLRRLPDPARRALVDPEHPRATRPCR